MLNGCYYDQLEVHIHVCLVSDEQEHRTKKKSRLSLGKGPEGCTNAMRTHFLLRCTRSCSMQLTQHVLVAIYLTCPGFRHLYRHYFAEQAKKALARKKAAAAAKKGASSAAAAAAAREAKERAKKGKKKDTSHFNQARLTDVILLSFIGAETGDLQSVHSNLAGIFPVW